MYDSLGKFIFNKLVLILFSAFLNGLHFSKYSVNAIALQLK